MLGQTILGTECSLSHFQKTSYLPWQRQSGERQKKEKGIKKKTPCKQSCFTRVEMMPTPTVLNVIIFFLRGKTFSWALVPLTPPPLSVAQQKWLTFHLRFCDACCLINCAALLHVLGLNRLVSLNLLCGPGWWCQLDKTGFYRRGDTAEPLDLCPYSKALPTMLMNKRESL